MADNKTKPTKLSVSAYINAIPDDAKRADAKALVKLMQSATGERPQMWGPSIIGFGSYHYTYEAGARAICPLLAFRRARRQRFCISCWGSGETGALLAKLGNHKAGKGCVYIKKLADVDRKVLEALIIRSVSLIRAPYPG